MGPVFAEILQTYQRVKWWRQRRTRGSFMCLPRGSLHVTCDLAQSIASMHLQHKFAKFIVYYYYYYFNSNERFHFFSLLWTRIWIKGTNEAVRIWKGISSVGPTLCTVTFVFLLWYFWLCNKNSAAFLKRGSLLDATFLKKRFMVLLLSISFVYK